MQAENGKPNVEPVVVTGSDKVYGQAHASSAGNHVTRDGGQTAEYEDKDRIMARHTEGTPTAHWRGSERPGRCKREREREGELSDEELLRRSPEEESSCSKG